MGVLRLEKLSIITFLLMMILNSCNEKTIKHNLGELDMAQSVFLTEPEIVVEGLVSTPSDIISSDTLVIFCDRRSKDMIQVYSENGQFITGLLQNGRGPGESTNILKISNGVNHSIYATVANETVLVYDLKEVMEGNALPDNIIALPNGCYAFSSIALLDSSLFYVGKNIPNIGANQTLYCLYDLKSEEMAYFGFLPEEDTNTDNYPVKDNTVHTIYQGEPLSRPDNKKVIVPFYYSVGFEIVDVLDKKVDISKFYTMPDVDIITLPELGINAVKRKESSEVGFLDVKCTQDYFYLLFSGKQFGNPTYNQGNYILKYDWNGNLKVKYELDWNISSFCLNRGNDALICVGEDENGSNIIRYKL